MTKKETLYISYADPDRAFVRRLASNLEEAGIRVSFDELLTPGDSWAATLREAIESAPTFLAVLSPGYLNSRWAKEELIVARQQEIEGRTRVILLMSQNCDLPGALARETYVDFTQDYHSGLQRLVAQLACPPHAPVGSRQSPASGTRKVRAAVADGQSNLDDHEKLNFFRPVPPRQPSSKPPLRAAGDTSKACFVVMPFDNADLDVVYEDFIRPILAEQCGLTCRRGDSVFGSNVIMQDVLNQIGESDFILADLTGCNPNVLYEVGICDTLNKPVLLLTQSKDSIPFDLGHRRVLIYDYSPRGCKTLERSLPGNVAAVLGSQR
ncbi:toll/interleukin-1 receptor domain-containing protein [Accumulibacter sp.]|uniref:toll/interleukin-1 receptor domain-containing protein n=1 Tax=Accumulibacter sp. TaxID=2053492 RepID=UPI001ACA886E|nr:toll/interleukin-1 receptor domain-containing protein [Accumulibacter sp.]MBN8454861.1 toll/interleukin-1 receptor domain-containing protein [Accumulibacter sp.]MBO3708000.1 toll/interleukin-1 receptor domain-containing protein [Candidatus Accumulibacter conexus]